MSSATVMNVGPYDSVPPAYFAIEQWMSDNGHVAGGRPWESYLDGPDVPEPRTLVNPDGSRLDVVVWKNQ